MERIGEIEKKALWLERRSQHRLLEMKLDNPWI